jgi:hypothetical protein
VKLTFKRVGRSGPITETLGSLCDKLTIVKLRRWQSEDADLLKSLVVRQTRFHNEIDEFMKTAIASYLNNFRIANEGLNPNK